MFGQFSGFQDAGKLLVYWSQWEKKHSSDKKLIISKKANTYSSSQQAFLDLFQFCKEKFINFEEKTTD
jgi:hypothetical protein